MKYSVIGTVLFGISVVWGARYFGKLFKVAGHDGAKVRPEPAVSALFLDRPGYDSAFRFDGFW